MEPTEERRFNRRGFIMGAAAVTGVAVVGTPLAFPAESAPLPMPLVGKWLYVALDADQIGAAAWAPPGSSGCGGKSAGLRSAQACALFDPRPGTRPGTTTLRCISV